MFTGAHTSLVIALKGTNVILWLFEAYCLPKLTFGVHEWQDFNTKDCDYTPDKVLYLVILPQILAKICLSSTTCTNWRELVWKGANQMSNSTRQTGHGSLKMFQTACSLEFCQAYIWRLPAWGDPMKICASGTQQKWYCYTTWHTKKLMLSANRCQIRLHMTSVCPSPKNQTVSSQTPCAFWIILMG